MSLCFSTVDMSVDRILCFLGLQDNPISWSYVSPGEQYHCKNCERYIKADPNPGNTYAYSSHCFYLDHLHVLRAECWSVCWFDDPCEPRSRLQCERLLPERQWPLLTPYSALNVLFPTRPIRSTL